MVCASLCRAPHANRRNRLDNPGRLARGTLQRLKNAIARDGKRSGPCVDARPRAGRSLASLSYQLSCLSRLRSRLINRVIPYRKTKKIGVGRAPECPNLARARLSIQLSGSGGAKRGHHHNISEYSLSIDHGSCRATGERSDSFARTYARSDAPHSPLLSSSCSLPPLHESAPPSPINDGARTRASSELALTPREPCCHPYRSSHSNCSCP